MGYVMIKWNKYKNIKLNHLHTNNYTKNCDIINSMEIGMRTTIDYCELMAVDEAILNINNLLKTKHINSNK